VIDVGHPWFVPVPTRMTAEVVGVCSDVQPEGAWPVQPWVLIAGIVLGDDGGERLALHNPVGGVVREQVAPADLRRAVPRRRLEEQDIPEAGDESVMSSMRIGQVWRPRT